MNRRTNRRNMATLLVAATSVLVVATSMPAWAVDDPRTPSTPAVAPLATTQDPPASALDWLERELEHNGFAMPAAFGLGSDWGVTIDAALALVADGRADSATARATTDNVIANAGDYLTGRSIGAPDDIYAGPASKTLLLAQLEGVDTGDIGDRDLEATTRALMQSSGDEAGRFSDVSAFGDTSNGFGQALTIVVLAHSDAGVPSAAIRFLLAQQCPGGGFRLFYRSLPDDPAGCASDAEADTDATSLAVQALLAAPQMPSTNAATDAALAWLVGKQDGTGAFSGSGPTAFPNANSTGLAAATFRDAGNAGVAAAAQGWLESLQLTETDPSSSAAAEDAGAIPYDPATRDAAIASGIPPELRDQLRRATAQAVLGLGLHGYATLGGDRATPIAPRASASSSAPSPGDTITVNAIGFLTDEPVRATLHSDPIAIGTKNTNGGAVSFRVAVPAGFATGVHTLVLTGAVSGATSTVALRVQGIGTEGGTISSIPTGSGASADRRTLPRTGGNVDVLVVIALLALAIGGVAANVKRCRVARASRS